jgi:hypothetical protein
MRQRWKQCWPQQDLMSAKYHALLATLRGEAEAREPNDAELQAAVERLRT